MHNERTGLSSTKLSQNSESERSLVQTLIDSAGLVHDYYHVARDVPRNTGTHFGTVFKLQTRAPGIYPVTLSFLEGVSKRLTIRVEDKPKTPMRCYMRGHVGCFVRPQPTLH
jgi:hypothetical protein